MGVWVTVEGETEYIRNCFEEYNAHTDPSGRYFTLYKRWHLIGLEVGMSVASVALRGEATGVATVLERRRRRHRQARPEAGRDARRRRRLHGVGQAAAGRDLAAPWAACRSAWRTTSRSSRAVKKGQSLGWADVAMDTSTDAYRIRREMEALVRGAAPEDGLTRLPHSGGGRHRRGFPM